MLDGTAAKNSKERFPCPAFCWKPFVSGLPQSQSVRRRNETSPIRQNSPPVLWMVRMLRCSEKKTTINIPGHHLSDSVIGVPALSIARRGSPTKHPARQWRYHATTQAQTFHQTDKPGCERSDEQQYVPVSLQVIMLLCIASMRETIVRSGSSRQVTISSRVCSDVPRLPA